MYQHSSMRISISALIWFVTTVVILAGCGGGGGGGSSAVSVSNLTVSPQTVLPEDNVTIDANVAANAGINSVVAIVTRPDRSTVSKNMTQKAGSNTWEVIYGQQPDETVQAGTYSVQVTATDVNGNIGKSNTGTFSVEGPPPPPSSGP